MQSSMTMLMIESMFLLVLVFLEMLVVFLEIHGKFNYVLIFPKFSGPWHEI